MKTGWTLLSFAVWSLAFTWTAGAEPAAVQVPSVAYGNTVEAVVTNAQAVSSFLVVGGRVRKLGAGELAVTNSIFTGGSVDVEQGSLTLQADSSLAAFPFPQSVLTTNLLLWVDATTNVVTDGGTPARTLRWHDVRETNTAAPAYLYAGQHNADPGPTLASRAWLGAQPYLEFGKQQSNGCWLAFMQPGAGGTVTSNKTLTVQSLFAVRGTQGGSGYHGFFFGNWSGTGNGGSPHFHPSASSAAVGPVWNEQAAAGLQFDGATSLDGRRVNGYEEYPSDWYQLVGVHMLSNTAELSNFFNDRNFRAAAQGFRQGGGQLGEVLLFRTALSENDRLAVEGYLLGKWLNRSQDGFLRVSAGASAELTAETGKTLTLSGLEGDGTLVKSGEGPLQLRKNAGLPPRVLRLLGGSLALGPLVTRSDALVEVTTNAAAEFAAGGRRVTVTNGTYTCVANSAAGVLTKDGSGEWSVAQIPDGVKTMRVEGGSLRVMPRPAAARGAFVAGSVPNPSFESPGTLQGWNYNITDAGWTFMPQLVITEIDSTNQVNKGSGLTAAAVGTPWLSASIPTWDGGRYVAFVQRSGTLQGTVTLPEAGSYKLSFAHAKRTGIAYPPHLLEIWFDGAIVGMAEADSDFFKRRECRFPYRAAGSYTLLFQGVHREAGDRTSLIDDIRLERVEEGDDIVPDGSFEGTGTLSLRLAGQTRFELGSVLNGRGWTFSDAITNLLPNAGNLYGTNVAAGGVAENVGGWMATPVSGGRASFIIGNGQLGVTLTFPTAGVYRVSFLGAGGVGSSTLSKWQYYPNVNGRHTLNLKLDGATIVPVTLGPTAFQRYDIPLPAVTNGQVSVLTFAGNSGTNTLSRIGLIDDVQVKRVGPDVVQNAGFETSLAWTFLTSAESGDVNTKSGLTSARSAFSLTVPHGAQAAYLQKTAYLRQTVTFPADGFFTVSFMAAARTQGDYTHTGHDFALQLDGATVGTVTTTGYLYDRYTFRLPYVKAGVAYLLAFQGLNTAGGDRSSAIDDVRVERLPVEDEAFQPFPSDLTVELAEGTRLALDFADTLPLRALRVDGRLVSGVISASSHPGVVAGAGALLVPNSGTILFFK